MRRTLPGNEEAYCSYGCGLHSQPNHAAATLKRTPGSNNDGR